MLQQMTTHQEAPTAADLITSWRNARRNYRAAWFAYQAASGPDFLPALDAWIAADREAKRIEASTAAARQGA